MASPALRFFYGRENKLPVDHNMFMALIAPRGLMLSTAINEGAGNPWGIEQAYFLQVSKVYKFLAPKTTLLYAYGMDYIVYLPGIWKIISISLIIYLNGMTINPKTGYFLITPLKNGVSLVVKKLIRWIILLKP